MQIRTVQRLRVMKTKFPATVMVFGVVSNEGHILPPHIFEVCLKVNTKVYLDVLKSVVIPRCNQVAGGRPWVWQSIRRQFGFTSRFIHPGDDLKFTVRPIYLPTHILPIRLHTIIRKYNQLKHQHACADKVLYTVLTFFYLYFSFFSISSLFFVLNLMIIDDKTA